MRWSVAVFVVLVGILLLDRASASIQPSGQHWARTTSELRLSIQYGPGVDVAALKNAAANWSQSPYIEMGVSGPVADSAACLNDQYYQYALGVIVACYKPDGSAPYSGYETHVTECPLIGWQPGCDNEHMRGAEVVQALLLQDEFTWCHELGHALGLDHETGATCMNPFWYQACPGSADFASLAQLYAHTDTYDSAAVATWTSGAAWCFGQATPTPSPTPSPTMTPCVTPNAKSKKCK